MANDTPGFNRSRGDPAIPGRTVLESTWDASSPPEADPVCTDSCANFCKVLSTNKNAKIHLKKSMDFFSQPPFTFLPTRIPGCQLPQMHFYIYAEHFYIYIYAEHPKNQFPPSNSQLHINYRIIASSFICLFLS